MEQNWSLSSIKRSPLVQRQTLSATRLPHKNTSSSSSTSSSPTTLAILQSSTNGPSKNVETLTNSSSVRRNSAARCRTPCVQLERSLVVPVALHLPLPPLPAVATATASSCDENVKTAWSTYCGATCAFERAVQAQRTALGLEDDDNASGSFWF